jgi:hypothetical protein
MNDIVREIELCKLLDQELSGDAKKINDFFIELFDGLEEYIDEKYPYKIFYIKRGTFYMEQNSKNKRMYLSYKDIWSFFETEFSYNHNQIKELTQYMLELHMKRKVFQTFLNFSIS